MYKQLAALTLGLISASTAAAQTPNADLVIVWGDSIAAGFNSNELPVDLTTSGPAPGIAAGNGAIVSRDSSAAPFAPVLSSGAGIADMGWATPTQAAPNVVPGQELGFGAVLNYPRVQSGKKLYVINLAVPQTDLNPNSMGFDGFWAKNDVTGGLVGSAVLSMDPLADLDAAIALLPEPAVLRAVAFSCGNNAQWDLMVQGGDVLAVGASIAAEALKTCKVIEARALLNSNVTLDSAANYKRLPIRRHDLDLAANPPQAVINRAPFNNLAVAAFAFVNGAPAANVVVLDLKGLIPVPQMGVNLVDYVHPGEDRLYALGTLLALYAGSY